QLQAGTPQWVLLPEPSAAAPVVFPLNGFDEDAEQQEHLVLSEDDYMAHLVRLTRDQEQLLPANVLRLLAENSFLFLGYQLDDWEFRLILQSMMKSLAGTNRTRKMHVGVQLDPATSPSEPQVRDYLARYLGQFHIAIYWGTPQQFASELNARWQTYLRTSEDSW
ncbi:MAG TPA: SIR2 family protein, partial [Caldilineaceae bacterium]|nr:SIR2 family protein [Caldilineaceae bacterium]